MPCNSDYLNPTHEEKELSQIACLLDELDGKKKIDKSHWSGHHPKVYGKRVNGDELIAKLCSRLKKEDVSKRSLEMQIWWRDHKRADKKRIANEAANRKFSLERKAAIKKLTAKERRLLGL